MATLTGTSGNDTITGTIGDDFISLLDGDDSANGSNGDDGIFGGGGNDNADAGTGNDHVQGEFGRDTLQGGLGNDILFGGRQSDVLFGGEGNDTLVDETGRDILWGDAGRDLFQFQTLPHNAARGGPNLLYGGTGYDTVETLFLSETSDIRMVIGARGVFAIDGEVVAHMNSVEAGRVWTGTGDDFLLGGDGADSLFGGGGADTIRGGGGDDLIQIADVAGALADGGAGVDELSFVALHSCAVDVRVTASGALHSIGGVVARNFELFSMLGSLLDDTLRGSAGADYISGYYGDDTVFGGAGNDDLQKSFGDDTIFCGKGDDKVLAGPYQYLETGSSTVYGQSGDDFLAPGQYRDTLFGGLGDDRLDGGRGGRHDPDHLFGGQGSDTFIYKVFTDSGRRASEADRIHGFEGGTDAIDLSAMPGGAFVVVASFTGSGFSEAMIVTDGPGRHRLLLDVVNADQRADFTLRILGDAPVAGDLIL